MSWNDQDRDDKGKRKDPWGSQNEGPPDLDEALSQFQNKLRKMFGGGENNNGNGFSQPRAKSPKPGAFGMGLIALIIVAVYVISGIYIVEPPERAVVTRFGHYIETTGPGPHWLAPIIESKKIVNVEKIHTETFLASMLTKDKNIAQAEIAIQYRIGDAEAFLFNLSDPLNTLSLAMRSALRSGVGRATLDEIMTEGRTQASLYIRDQVQGILDSYKSGILITRANLRKTTVPDGEVQEAYDDANAARQDQEKFVNEALAEKVKLINRAEGDSASIIQAAEGYKASKILEANGYAKRFLEILPEYRAAPKITRDRLYIETMQEVYGNSGKVIMDVENGNNLVYIPLDKIADQKGRVAAKKNDYDPYAPPELDPTVAQIQREIQSTTSRPTRSTYSGLSRPERGGRS